MVLLFGVFSLLPPLTSLPRKIWCQSYETWSATELENESASTEDWILKMNLPVLRIEFWASVLLSTSAVKSSLLWLNIVVVVWVYFGWLYRVFAVLWSTYMHESCLLISIRRIIFVPHLPLSVSIYHSLRVWGFAQILSPSSMWSKDRQTSTAQ